MLVSTRITSNLDEEAHGARKILRYGKKTLFSGSVASLHCGF